MSAHTGQLGVRKDQMACTSSLPPEGGLLARATRCPSLMLARACGEKWGAGEAWPVCASSPPPEGGCQHKPPTLLHGHLQVPMKGSGEPVRLSWLILEAPLPEKGCQQEPPVALRHLLPLAHTSTEIPKPLH